MKLPPGHVAGQGVAKPKCTGGFGERMLRSMGWDAGQGLGKQGTGIKEAIQVKKKEDTVGVGGNGSYDWAEKWWEKAFDSAVQTLGDSDSSSTSDSDSDDERMAAVVAAVNRDGTRTSASAEELKLLASLSKGGRVAAGRFGGRDAKLARIRQQEAAMAAAAAAKLGVPSAPSDCGPATAAGQGGSERSETTSEVKLSNGSGKKRKAGGEAEAGGEGGSKKKKKKAAGKKAKGTSSEQECGQQQPAEAQQQQQQQPPPKKARIVIEPVVASCGPTYEFVPTPTTGWWGEKLFASAGCLEGLDKAAAEAQRRRVTFDEDDQAQIYNSAQAKKTQGKVGLGQGTGTVKVGGVKWEGKRVSFEEPEEEKGGGEAAAADAGSAPLAATGSCTHLDHLAGGAGGGQGAAAAGQAAPTADGWASAVKWKKIIVSQLQAAEARQLRLKELQRLVVAAVLAKHSSIVQSKAAVKAALAARLGSSSKWAVQGKLVWLRS